MKKITLKIIKEQSGEENTKDSAAETPVAPTPPEKKQEKCSVNQACFCVDRTVSAEISVLSVQRALKKLGFEIEENGKCTDATRQVIMDFQKQHSDFQTIDGQPFLRCDGCVGVNTSAAINAELKNKGINKSLEQMLTSQEKKSYKKRTKLSIRYEPGKVKDLEQLDDNPLKGEIEEFKIPGSSASIFYNIKGSRERYVRNSLEALISGGITNPYIIMGCLGTIGKESGYRIIFEKAGYSFRRIKNKDGAVARRVWRRFKEQGFGAPEDRHIRALTGGGKNGVALFNIAYGYSPYQEDERITMPVLVDGEINPKLYNKNLAGWKYRGTGPIQNTYKENHRKSALKMGIPFSDLQRLLNNKSTQQMTAIKLAVGAIKLTYPRLLKKYGREPTTITEGLQWAISAAGGPGFPDPLKPGTTLHKTFKRGITFVKNHFRLKVEPDPIQT